jgi:hypothetical protein
VTSRSTDLPGAPTRPTSRGRTTIMAAKPKPQPSSDEAREAARRALQTSMDTRQ